MKRIRITLQSIIIFAVGATVFLIGLQLSKRLADKNRENERLKVKLAHARIASPLSIDTIRDSIRVPVVKVIEVEKSTYKKELADRPLLKDMGLKAGDVEMQQRTGTVIRDTVMISGYGGVPAEFCYKDRWAEFRISLRDSTLAYAVRDSVTTIVFREYKHHFLWWRWGTKGYRVKVVNFNPHSTLLYNQYIKVDR